MAEPRAGAEVATLWYVQASERVWGPFPQARLSRFVSERRLTPASLVASQPDGPFGPAEHRLELAILFEAAEPFADPSEHAPAVHAPAEHAAAEQTAAGAGETATPALRARPRRGELVTLRPKALRPKSDPASPLNAAPAAPSPKPTPSSEPAPGPEPAAAPRPSNTLLVSADLASLSSVAFEAALSEQGRFAGVRLGAWLVRTPLDATTLRNRLSRRLGAGDTLLVVDAPLDRAAWFNLDPEAEWNLRQLWTATV